MEENHEEAQIVSEEVTTPQSEAQKNEAVNSNVLFGTISYENEEAYEKFITNMNVNQAIFVLVASTNFSQAKGAFNLLESETLSAAIRAIRKSGQNLDPTSK